MPLVRGPRVVKAMVASAAMLLSACGDGADEEGGGGPRGPVQVGFVVVQPGSAPVEQQLPARVAAYQLSEVRPQISGVILRRMFREGSLVQRGQTLY